jgi:methylmalonyl-CoA epimerase
MVKHMENIMKTQKISHIGIAVTNIDEQLKFYRNTLGLEFTGIEIIKDQQVKVAFITVGDSRIELLEPTSKESPVQKFIDSNNGKSRIHHIAYEVENLDEAIKEAKDSGLKMVDETPRRGAGNVRIAFIHPRDSGGILTELCETH